MDNIATKERGFFFFFLREREREREKTKERGYNVCIQFNHTYKETNLEHI